MSLWNKWKHYSLKTSERSLPQNICSLTWTRSDLTGEMKAFSGFCLTQQRSFGLIQDFVLSLKSLGPSVSWGLGAPSLNEHRPGSPLLYVCWGPPISWCMLLGGPVFERSWGSRLIETAGSPTGLPFSSASLSLLYQQQRSAASVHWFGANIYIWFYQLFVGSFGGQS